MAQDTETAMQKPVATTGAQMPATPPQATPAQPENKPISPTRYGDWEINGRCIDF